MSNDLGCLTFSTSSSDVTSVVASYAVGSNDAWTNATCIATTTFNEPITISAGDTINYTYHYVFSDGKGYIEVVPPKKKKWNHEE